METFFNIRYEFNRTSVLDEIDNAIQVGTSGYVCVADANVVTNAFNDLNYAAVLNEGLFAISDSSWIPVFIRWIYGKKYSHYCGSMIFEDIVRSRKYRMLFLGAHQKMLDALQRNITQTMNPDVRDMTFVELPFCDVELFDYEGIAKLINSDGADIIWVGLGAPKQERFMNKLKPHLKKGVMIAVGAVFKFYSGQEEKRAPNWILRCKLEFLYRIFQEPKKQFKRCVKIIRTIPLMLFTEWRNKSKNAY